MELNTSSSQKKKVLQPLHKVNILCVKLVLQSNGTQQIIILEEEGPVTTLQGKSPPCSTCVTIDSVQGNPTTNNGNPVNFEFSIPKLRMIYYTNQPTKAHPITDLVTRKSSNRALLISLPRVKFILPPTPLLKQPFPTPLFSWPLDLFTFACLMTTLKIISPNSKPTPTLKMISHCLRKT